MVVFSISMSAANGAMKRQNIGRTILNFAANGRVEIPSLAFCISVALASGSASITSTCPASAGHGRRKAYMKNNVTGKIPITDIVALGLICNVDVQKVYRKAPSNPADPPPVVYPPNADAEPINAG